MTRTILPGTAYEFTDARSSFHLQKFIILRSLSTILRQLLRPIMNFLRLLLLRPCILFLHLLPLELRHDLLRKPLSEARLHLILVVLRKSLSKQLRKYMNSPFVHGEDGSGGKLVTHQQIPPMFSMILCLDGTNVMVRNDLFEDAIYC